MITTTPESQNTCIFLTTAVISHPLTIAIWHCHPNDVYQLFVHGQDSQWKSQSEWHRTETNGESTSMVWPTLGWRTAKEQNIQWSILQNAHSAKHKGKIKLIR